jgi:hypothetical protein
MPRDARELAIPPTAAVDTEAIEILRAWVTKGNLEVGLIRAWDQPDPWGILLVDLARHAARAFAQEGICSEHDALERIRALFEAEWDKPTDLGKTQQFRRQ